MLSRKKLGKKPVVSKDNIFMLEFVNLFGLKNWEDSKHFWTLKDITPNILKIYVEVIRPRLLDLNIPSHLVRKINVEKPNSRDLNTMLNQMAQLYGYTIQHVDKGVKNPATNKTRVMRLFQLVPYSDEEDDKVDDKKNDEKDDKANDKEDD